MESRRKSRSKSREKAADELVFKSQPVAAYEDNGLINEATLAPYLQSEITKVQNDEAEATLYDNDNARIDLNLLMSSKMLDPSNLEMLQTQDHSQEQQDEHSGTNQLSEFCQQQEQQKQAHIQRIANMIENYGKSKDGKPAAPRMQHTKVARKHQNVKLHRVDQINQEMSTLNPIRPLQDDSFDPDLQDMKQQLLAEKIIELNEQKWKINNTKNEKLLKESLLNQQMYTFGAQTQQKSFTNQDCADTTKRISSIQMAGLEQWINVQLDNMQIHEDRAISLTPNGSSVPMQQLNVDRVSLLKAGLSHEGINAIYRGIFVHSVGWYDALKSSVKRAPKKQQFAVMEKLWKLYILMLEHCNKTNYKQLIIACDEEYRKLFKAQEEAFRNKEVQYQLDDEKNRRQIDKDKAEITELGHSLQVLQKDLHDIREEYATSQERSEETTKLKIYMEHNMKHLHALHRNTQSKYNRALQDIYDLQILFKQSSEKERAYALELAKVKGESIIQVSQIQRLQDQLTIQESECEAQLGRANQLQLRVTELLDKTDEQFKQMKEAELKMEEMSLNEEELQRQIQELTSNVKNLEIVLKEANLTKRDLQERADAATAKLEKAQNTLDQQTLSKKEVEIVRNDRDMRVNEMRAEITLLEKRLIESERQVALYHEKFNMQVERCIYLEEEKLHAESSFNKLTQERDSVQKKLTSTLAEAVQNQLSAKQLQSQFEYFRSQYEKAERREKINEAEIQQLTLQLNTAIDLNKIEKATSSKTIDMLQETIKKETSDKQMWMQKVLEAQQREIELNSTVVKLETNMQEHQNQLKDLQTKLASKVDTNARFMEEHEKIVGEKISYEKQLQYLEQEIEQNKEMIAYVRKVERTRQAKMHDEHEKSIRNYDRLLNCHTMQFEELRTVTGLRQERISELEKSTKSLIQKLSAVTADRDRLVIELKQAIENTKVAQKEKEQLNKRLSDTQTDLESKITELTSTQKKLKESLEQIKDLTIMAEQVPTLKQQVQELTAFREAVMAEKSINYEEAMTQTEWDMYSVAVQTEEKGLIEMRNQIEKSLLQQVYKVSLDQNKKRQIDTLATHEREIEEKDQVIEAKDEELSKLKANLKLDKSDLIPQGVVAMQERAGYMRLADSFDFRSTIQRQKQSRDSSNSLSNGGATTKDRAASAGSQGNTAIFEIGTFDAPRGTEPNQELAQEFAEAFAANVNGQITSQNLRPQSQYVRPGASHLAIMNNQLEQVKILNASRAQSKEGQNKKRVFRIRSSLEKASLREDSNQNLDHNQMAQQVKNLRKHHDNMIQRPVTAQTALIKNRRSNLYSAVSRPQKEFAFGAPSLKLNTAYYNENVKKGQVVPIDLQSSSSIIAKDSIVFNGSSAQISYRADESYVGVRTTTVADRLKARNLIQVQNAHMETAKEFETSKSMSIDELKSHQLMNDEQQKNQLAVQLNDDAINQSMGVTPLNAAQSQSLLTNVSEVNKVMSHRQQMNRASSAQNARLMQARLARANVMKQNGQKKQKNVKIDRPSTSFASSNMRRSLCRALIDGQQANNTPKQGDSGKKLYVMSLNGPKQPKALQDLPGTIAFYPAESYQNEINQVKAAQSLQNSINLESYQSIPISGKHLNQYKTLNAHASSVRTLPSSNF